MKSITGNIIILAIILAAVLLMRLYVVGSYCITGSPTGETLKNGDFVLVNKLKTNPTNDRNRLLLYKSPLRRDAAKPPLFVGRCIGVPGDVIQMGINGFRVNGQLLPNAPMMQPTFRIKKDIKESLLHTLESLQIPFRQLKEDSTGVILRLSIREKELLLHNLSKVVPVETIEEYTMDYEFVIPGKGKTIALNEITLMVCREAIIKETNKTAIIRDGKLFIQDEEKTNFLFKNDYFWILSENEMDGIDSRHLGLIPHDHIIGKIWFCWYSKYGANRFKKIK
jgi:signal peptidase I